MPTVRSHPVRSQPVRSLVQQSEEHPALPPGDDERFNGYAVMSLPFSSGHVLGLRRFSITSVGPAYTSVWLRRPTGAWSIFTTVDPGVSCPRYFGSALESTSVHDITITWTDDSSFTVNIGDEVDLRWRVRVSATPVTRMMSGVTHALPESMWRNRTFLKAMGVMAGPSLRAGRVTLTGLTPNRQRFRAGPKRMWFVEDSTALLGGTNLGVVAPLNTQTRLADFWIPQRGIFMIGSAVFDAFEPTRHLNSSTGAA